MKKKLTAALVCCLCLAGSLNTYAESAVSSAAEAAADAEVQSIGAHVVEIEKYGNMVLDITGTEVLSSGIEIGDIVTVSLNNNEYDMPVVTAFSDVDQGSMLFRAVIQPETQEDYTLIAINMGDLATWAGIATRSNTDEAPGYVWELNEGVPDPIPVTVTLKEKGGYDDQLKLHKLVRSDKREDYPDLSDAEFANFRVISTSGMGENVLYRSSSPVNPGINRNKEADEAAKEAGVRTFINLADSEGTMKAYEGFDDTYYSTQDIVCLNMVVDFQSDEFRDGLAKGITFITEHEGPYMVHCNVGKDRSGFACAVLEAFMGAGADDIIADYMVTFYNYYGVKPGTVLYMKIAKANICKSLAAAFGLESIEGADLEKAAREYLIGIGLSEETLERLYDKLKK